MGKYESPCQIFSLFLGASLISVVVILVIRIEAQNRYGLERQAQASSQVQTLMPASSKLEPTEPHLNWAQALTSHLKSLKTSFRTWMGKSRVNAGDGMDE